MAWERKNEHGVPTPVREGGRLPKFHAAAKVPRRRTIRYLRIVLGCQLGSRL